MTRRVFHGTLSADRAVDGPLLFVMSPPLVYSTAGELGAAIRNRSISAVELLDAHLEQISRWNPTVNAVVTIDAERARQRAQEADDALAKGIIWGPLHGIPMTLKDCHSTADMLTTAGFPPLSNYVPATDGSVAARVKRAGAVILGKTNVPSLLSEAQTVNPIFGRTNNPWDVTRTPGGSSGGACAALASGMTSLEIGSDTGGSIRLPAHFCGVFGLRPTPRRVPVTGHIPEIPSTPRIDRFTASIGPLARSVQDLAEVLRILSGPDGFDTEVPPLPWIEVPPVDLTQLRIAWVRTFPGVPVSAEIGDLIANLAAELDRRGAQIEETCPTISFDWQHDLWIRWYRLGVHLMTSFYGPLASNSDRDAPPPTLIDMIVALNERDSLICEWERFFEKWDVLLCPVAMTSAFPHCAPNKPIIVDGKSVELGQINRHCSPFSLTGSPAIVIPVSTDGSGLPIGAQLVGKRWSDEVLLSAAQAIAEVSTGFQIPPGYG